MATVKSIWTMRLFDVNGFSLMADMSEYSNLGALTGDTDMILHPHDAEMGFFLNSVDQLTFGLNLFDPMALLVTEGECVVKVWRTLYDEEDNIVYQDPSTNPCFAGVCAQVDMDGEGGLAQYTFYSPLWRLQSRFHLLNHYLEINVDTGNPYKQSELMWKLIDLVNEAFGFGVGSESYTGISKGTFFDLANEPAIAPYYVQKGSNTWANLFDDIMTRAAGIDISPRYFHLDGNPRLMYFDTVEKRGIDQSGFFSFDYRTGLKNVNNMRVSRVIVPGEFGNYLWAVGQGGPNSGKIAVDLNTTSVGYGMNAIGVYMVRKDFPNEKRVGNAGPPPTFLKNLSVSEFAQRKQPQRAYEIELSPAGNLYYAANFNLGDVIALNADKGAMKVENEKQRIYECRLRWSENNMETSTPLISKDFYGKVSGE